MQPNSQQPPQNNQPPYQPPQPAQPSGEVPSVSPFDVEPTTQPQSTAMPQSQQHTPQYAQPQPAAQQSYGAAIPSPNPAYAQPHQSGTPPKKASKKPLILGALIAGVLLVLGGGGAAAYAFWYQNPSKVVADAIDHVSTAEYVQTTTVVPLDEKIKKDAKKILGSDMSPEDIAISTMVSPGEKANIDVKMRYDYKGKSSSMGASMRLDGEKSTYLRYDGVSSMLTRVLDSMGTQGAGVILSAYRPMIELFKHGEGEWVYHEIDDSDRSEVNVCTRKVREKYEKGELEKIFSKVYQKYPFFALDDTVKKEDGNLGYLITFDEKVFSDFYDEIKKEQVIKEILDCRSDKNGSVSDESADALRDQLKEMFDTDKNQVIVWISRFGHTLQKIDVKLTIDTPSMVSVVGSSELRFSTNFAYDTSKVVDTPKEYQKSDEWLKKMQQKMQEIQTKTTQERAQLYSPYSTYPPTTQQRSSAANET